MYSASIYLTQTVPKHTLVERAGSWSSEQTPPCIWTPFQSPAVEKSEETGPSWFSVFLCPKNPESVQRRQ